MRVLLLFFIFTFPFMSALADEADPGESPFFLVTTEGAGAVDTLPLKSTRVDVQIAGVIASVRVTQLYANEGDIPLEAMYVFPGSTRAAVHAMQMRIGDRIRRAKIRKREQAKQAYEKAKSEGKSASLLEQKRPNVFQMSVANIMPGDEVEVQLSYSELLVPNSGMYQFVYPTVVGPRYASKEATSDMPQKEAWVENPYTHEGELPTYTFDIGVELLAGLPIQKVASSSHEIEVRYSEKSRAMVELQPGDLYTGNRDFILSYRLSGDSIQSGLLLHYDDEHSGAAQENFFLLMAQPPRQVTPEHIPAREYIFVVDVSGSMHGFPLEVSKSLLRNLIESLRPQDRFNIVLFAAGSAVLAEESVAGTAESIAEAVALIDQQSGGGGTELLAALKRSLALPKASGMSRSIVVVTDGYITAEAEAFDLIRENLGNANLFTFGIGSSVNRHLIEGLARVGRGEPAVVTRILEAPYAAQEFRRYISSPVLTDIEVSFEGFDAYDVEPLSQPDLFAERPLIVFGKWRGEKSGRIEVRGVSGNGVYSQSFDVSSQVAEPSLGVLRYLWARHKITYLSDYQLAGMNQSLVEEITELGLKYSLLTKYTSFIAVDEVVRNETAEGAVVTQPLPLPQGVSNHAVGGTSVPSVPEPEFYALLLLSLLILYWYYRPSLTGHRSPWR